MEFYTAGDINEERAQVIANKVEGIIEEFDTSDLRYEKLEELAHLIAEETYKVMRYYSYYKWNVVISYEKGYTDWMSYRSRIICCFGYLQVTLYQFH